MDEVTLVCVICGKRFTRAKNIAPKAKVCTPFSHICQGKTVKLPSGKEKYVPCSSNCCRSQYKRGQSSQFMDGVLEKGKYFDDQGELRKVLGFLDKAPKPIAMVIRFIASCGLRVKEPTLVRVGDCFLDDQIPHILVSTLKRKGHPKRRVDIETGFSKDLKKYLEELGRTPQEPVFDVAIRTVQWWWRKIQVMAGMKTIRSIHSLRHTHMTRLAEGGYDPKYTQQRAGWSSLEMYKVYAHVSDQMRKAAAAKLPKV